MSVTLNRPRTALTVIQVSGEGQSPFICSQKGVKASTDSGRVGDSKTFKARFVAPAAWILAAMLIARIVRGIVGSAELYRSRRSIRTTTIPTRQTPFPMFGHNTRVCSIIYNQLETGVVIVSKALMSSLYAIEVNGAIVPQTLQEIHARLARGHPTSASVGWDIVGERSVSTLFTGMNMGTPTEPLWYETRVFGPGKTVVTRYRTRKTATLGHKEVVESCRQFVALQGYQKPGPITSQDP